MRASMSSVIDIEFSAINLRYIFDNFKNVGYSAIITFNILGTLGYSVVIEPSTMKI